MHFLLIISITFITTLASAGLSCESLLTLENQRRVQALESARIAENEHKKRCRELRDRMMKYFGVDWSTGDKISDAYAAKRILLKLRSSGSMTDLAILDTYLSILELAGEKYEVRVPGFYIDLHMGWRPKSTHFQERHWDWNILEGYFFQSSSTITFAKQADLAYLKHVLKTAQSLPQFTAMTKILQLANNSWNLKNLSEFPELVGQFQGFLDNQAAQGHYRKLKREKKQWFAKFGGQEAEQVALTHEQLETSVAAFQSSNSDFDLFLFRKYFEKVRQFQITSDTLLVNTKMQMTNWEVFTDQLSKGSLGAATDFLFQNSHDTSMKSYLLRILNEMSLNDSQNFAEAFQSARARVDANIKAVAVPSGYQNDLRVFSVSGSSRHDPIGIARLDEVLVTWNSMLGKPQVNVIDSIPLSGKERTTVRASAKLMRYLNIYFTTLTSNGTFLHGEVEAFKERELNTPLARTSYLVFTERGSGDLLAMIRLFDGSRLDFSDGNLGDFYNKGDEKTYIEADYEEVKFPERELNIPIREMGRLYASPKVAAYALNPIMAQVADFLYNSGAKGVLYMDGARAAKIYYERNGAEIAYTPEQLQRPADETPKWILKASVSQIIHQFLNQNYQSVQRRSP